MSSSLCTEELKAQFGEIIPTELPLGNRFLFDYQKKFLESYCSEIHLTVPSNYTSRTNCDKIIRIDQAKSVSEVIRILCKKFEKSNLLILFGDTVILDSYELKENDFIGTSEHPGFNFNWFPVENKIFIGILGISCNSRKRNQILRSNSIEEIIRLYKTNESLNFDSWFDFGHKTTYSLNKIKFFETRGFNDISYSAGFLKKQSADWFKMYAEYSWLKLAAQIGYENTPQVRNFNYIQDKAGYEIEYKNYTALSDKFTFGKFDSTYEKDTLKLLLQTIKKNQNIGKEYFGDSSFIRKKLIERFTQVPERHRSKKLVETYQKTLTFFSDRKMNFTVIHGDLCYSNILFNEIEKSFYFIDPRGYLDKDEGFTLYGPKNYDLYKLAHSYVCGYDSIIAFNKIYDKEEIKLRLATFLELTNIERDEMIFGLIQLFVTMVPLHYDHPSRQEKFLQIATTLYDIL